MLPAEARAGLYCSAVCLDGSVAGVGVKRCACFAALSPCCLAVSSPAGPSIHKEKLKIPGAEGLKRG